MAASETISWLPGDGSAAIYADGGSMLPAHGFAFAFTHNRLTAPPDDTAADIAAAVRADLGIAE